MSGTLFVVATPIGNLEDITLRALRVLREADVIAAEDTRRTAGLLAAHGITTPTTSFHAHNSRARLPRLIEMLQLGRSIALVTDAGTPGVSDPGVELVRACVDQGLPVDVVPGPTAPIAAATVSGFPLAPLTVLGFVPRKTAERDAFFATVNQASGTICFFEAPHRIQTTLAQMATALGDRPICVAREITKLHQEFLRGTSAEVAARLVRPRGEFTVVVGPNSAPPVQPLAQTDAEVADEFGRSANSVQHGSRRQRISALAKRLGRSTGDVYAALERHKLGLETES
jgi:16S rRNA (cytidine1402-2'-O)-methyltransferase